MLHCGINSSGFFGKVYLGRAGSRIFRRVGRGPIGGGFGLRCGHFSVKLCVKTKELGPVGGRAPARP